MKTTITLIAAVLTLSIELQSLNCSAQAGGLDPTFSLDGIDTLAIGIFGSDYGQSVAIQSDSKIVVAGYSSRGSDFDFAVVRYNTDGTLDNTFSTDGKTTTDILEDDKAYSIAIQGDGKIVLAGESGNGPDDNFAVVRYNSDGSLDNTFGTGGIVTTNFGSFSDGANSVAIQGDGKIVLAGWMLNGSYWEFALARYNSNGTLDNTFGSGGKVTTSIGTGNDEGHSVAIQSDGKIIVAGFAQDTTGSIQDFAIVRYNSDGSLDNTFGTGGIVTTDFGGNGDDGRTVVIQGDGKIVVGGYCFNASIDFAMVRYNSNGTLDNSFDTDGKITTDIGGGGWSDYGYSAVIQGDGKIIMAGFTSINVGDFALVRYNSDGSMDSTFDTDGIITTDFGISADNGYGVALQADGKIVVSGQSIGMFAVARYNNDIGSGIKTITKKNTRVVVYPNPFIHSTTIEIKSEIRNAKYELLINDVLGQQVHKQTLNSKEENLNLNLPSGIYFYKITDEKKEMVGNGKVVIE